MELVSLTRRFCFSSPIPGPYLYRNRFVFAPFPSPSGPSFAHGLILSHASVFCVVALLLASLGPEKHAADHVT